MLSFLKVELFAHWTIVVRYQYTLMWSHTEGRDGNGCDVNSQMSAKRALETSDAHETQAQKPKYFGKCYVFASMFLR